ncbi:hypothetical protein AB2E24_18005 [Escherichia coli]
MTNMISYQGLVRTFPCVAQIARENGVNDNVIFKWLRLWQNEGRVSRRLPVTTSSDTGVELLPVEITPDEQKEPVAVHCAVFIHFHSDQSQCQFLQGGIPSR